MIFLLKCVTISLCVTRHVQIGLCMFMHVKSFVMMWWKIGWCIPCSKFIPNNREQQPFFFSSSISMMNIERYRILQYKVICKCCISTGNTFFGGLLGKRDTYWIIHKNRKLSRKSSFHNICARHPVRGHTFNKVAANNIKFWFE